MNFTAHLCTYKLTVKRKLEISYYRKQRFRYDNPGSCSTSLPDQEDIWNIPHSQLFLVYPNIIA